MKRKTFLVILTLILISSLIGLPAACFAPGEAPTLELEIYDGPDYSESDDMCYYRVEAIATGMPEPKIIFEDEDNLSTISSDRVKVGVKPGDSYSLSVTASNSAGTANFSIILKGECDELPSELELTEENTSSNKEDAETEKQEETDKEMLESEEEPEVAETESAEEESETGLRIVEAEIVEEGTDEDELVEKDLPSGPVRGATSITASESISGSIIGGRFVRLGTSPILIGDTTVGTQIKGYISFDIRELYGKTIEYAEIRFLNLERSNNPESFASSIVVKILDYGDSLDASDFSLSGDSLATIPISAPSYLISGDTVVEPLEKVLDTYVLYDRSGWSRYFQLSLELNAITNSDNVIDSVDIPSCSEEVWLFVDYIEPWQYMPDG